MKIDDTQRSDGYTIREQLQNNNPPCPCAG